MAHALYLTMAERKLFDVLPAALREGWEVTEETLTYEDTHEKLKTRAKLLQLDSPVLLAFQEKVKKAYSEEDMLACMKGLDFSSVSQRDLADIFFTVGPELVGIFIEDLLKSAQDDRTIDATASFTQLRKLLLESLQPHTPSPR